MADQLADDFGSQGYDKPTFIERLRRRLGDTHLAEVSLGSFLVEFENSHKAQSEFSALLQVDLPDFAYKWATIRCRLSWSRTGKVWLITKAEQIPNNVAPLRRLTDWLN